MAVHCVTRVQLVLTLAALELAGTRPRRSHRARGRDPGRGAAPPGPTRTGGGHPAELRGRTRRPVPVGRPGRRPARPVAGPLPRRRRHPGGGRDRRPFRVARPVAGDPGRGPPAHAGRPRPRRRRSGPAPVALRVVVGDRARPGRPPAAAARRRRPTWSCWPPPCPRPWRRDSPVPVRATIIGGSLVYQAKERARGPNRASIHSTRAGRSRTSRRRSPARTTQRPAPAASTVTAARRPRRPASPAPRATGAGGGPAHGQVDQHARRRRRGPRSTATAPTSPVIGSAMASPQKTGSRSASHADQAARHGGVVAEGHPVPTGRLPAVAGDAQPHPARPARGGRPVPGPVARGPAGREASITTSAASMSAAASRSAGRAAEVEPNRRLDRAGAPSW